MNLAAIRPATGPLDRLIDGQDESAYATHIARAPVPLALLDLDMRPVVLSPGWKAEAATPADSGSPMMDHFVGSTLAEAQAKCLTGEVVTCQIESPPSPSGETKWWAATLSAWPAGGTPRRLVLHLRDITEAILTAYSATQAQQRLMMALKLDRSIVIERNLRTGETALLSMCPDLDRFFAAGSPTQSAQDDDRQRLSAAYAACAREGTPFDISYRLKRDDGVETWIYAIGERFCDMTGTADRVITVFKDVTERHHQQKRVETLAYRDILTGLHNRAAFQSALAEAIADAEAHGEGLAVVMIDMDYFKQVNDTFGHDAGDALLRALAGQLRRAFRHGDTVARLGGDEFAVLLRGIRDPEALLRPIATLEALLKSPVQYAGQEFVISVSIGAALHAPGAADPSQIVKNADLAMYEAKTSGRSRSVLFENTMRTKVEERLQLLRDVRRGLAEREFFLVYQPIIDLASDRVEGLEALLRWDHPQAGLLAPGAFGAAFEDPDSAPLLSEFTVETALEQIRSWLDAGMEPPPVAINVSVAQLRDGRLARDIKGRLARWGVPGEALSIEVNETMSTGHGDKAASEAIRQLADAGVKLALDNFGTGQGSLGNPRDFPVTRLKIAKAFVAELDTDIVDSILRIGRALGLQVVADGVEGPEALAAVRRMGCSHAQGFLFSKPMPAADMTHYLKAAGSRP